MLAARPVSTFSPSRTILHCLAAMLPLLLTLRSTIVVYFTVILTATDTKRTRKPSLG